MGLNDSYSTIRSQIQLMNPLPSVSQAYSLICQEESHWNVTTFQPIADDPTTVFYSSSSKHSDIVKRECCSVPEHTKENCFRLIPYPPGHKLHKKFPQAKGSKAPRKNMRVTAHNSVNDASNTTSDVSSMHHSGVIFTPTQYAQILRLLENSATKPEPSADLAGTVTSLMTISAANDFRYLNWTSEHTTMSSIHWIS